MPLYVSHKIALFRRNIGVRIESLQLTTIDRANKALRNKVPKYPEITSQWDRLSNLIPLIYPIGHGQSKRTCSNCRRYSQYKNRLSKRLMDLSLIKNRWDFGHFLLFPVLVIWKIPQTMLSWPRVTENSRLLCFLNGQRREASHKDAHTNAVRLDQCGSSIRS